MSVKCLLRLFISLYVSGSTPVLAQQYVEASLHAGSILRIDPDYPENTQATLFAAATWSGKSSGRKEWHQLFGYPEWFLSGSVFWFGNPDVLGKGIGLVPGLRFSLVQNAGIHLQVGIGIGLAFINRPYDPISNPENNAIGSHLNNLTALELRATFFPGKNWQPFLGVGYPHFSNANASVPNLGINIPSGYVGLRRRFETQAWDPPTPAQEEPPQGIRIRPGFRVGYGMTEHKVGGGPRYGVLVGSAFLHTVLARKYRILLGTEWFFSYSSYAFLKNQDVTVENLSWAATGGIVFAGAELMLGHLSLAAYLGPYVKQAYQMPYTLYTKLGLVYHLTDQQQRPYGHPFLGAFVHAHSGEADFLEMGLGWVF